MFSLNPWFWVVMAALVLGGTAAGFVKGIEWEQGKNARSQVESLVKVIKTSKLVIKKDNAIVNSLEADKVQLRGELHDVRTEFDKLRDHYMMAVKWAIEQRRPSFMIVGGVIVALILLFRIVPGSFVPEEDQG